MIPTNDLSKVILLNIRSWSFEKLHYEMNEFTSVYTKITMINLV